MILKYLRIFETDEVFHSKNATMKFRCLCKTQAMKKCVKFLKLVTVSLTDFTRDFTSIQCTFRCLAICESKVENTELLQFHLIRT